MHSHRLVIVSNRLPVVLTSMEGKLNVQRGSGGLVTALAPVLRDRGGLWLGWSGSAGVPLESVNKALAAEQKKIGYALISIELTQKEIDDYYLGYSNEIIWPLFHDLLPLCVFEPRYWYTMQEVIEKFAVAVQENLRQEDLLWIHDYQLITLGQSLRKKGIDQKIAFFLHIPFPPLDIFLKLPWRFQVLKAILEYDLLGFQTLRDLRNFIQCVRLLLPECKFKAKKGHSHTIFFAEREIKAAAYPISINYQEFADAAASQEVSQEAWLFHEKLKDKKIVFSLDRLDFTKGIPYRLEAIRTLLKKYPELLEQVVFIQVVVPSRMGIEGYQDFKQQIDRLVSEINSEFTKNTWVPIHYIFKNLTRNELVMHYRTSEVCLVSSVKDGMNLVCKEYIASNVDGNGVLVLSEFAGAACQLFKEALIINPFDVEATCEAIYRALTMPKAERRSRMARMKRKVRKQDIFHWVQHFLNSAFAKELLQDFPLISDYIPTEELS